MTATSSLAKSRELQAAVNTASARTSQALPARAGDLRLREGKRPRERERAGDLLLLDARLRLLDAPLLLLRRRCPCSSCSSFIFMMPACSLLIAGGAPAARAPCCPSLMIASCKRLRSPTAETPISLKSSGVSEERTLRVIL